MYRLSKDFDLSFLVDAELLQVCVGKNEVILNFDRDVRITVLSDYAASSPSAISRRYTNTTDGCSALLALLHDRIVSAAATESGGLLLVFRGGATVEVFDTSDQYESFWIANGDRRIVV